MAQPTIFAVLVLNPVIPSDLFVREELGEITNGTLTVTPAGLTVVANDASRPYGAINPVFTGTIIGLQNDDGLSIKATYATTATVASSVGTYPITPTLSDTLGRIGNYTVTVTSGTLTVTSAAR